jgi:PAS domain S-box-containing protein
MRIMGNDKLQEKYQAFIRNSSEGIWLCELDEPVSIKLKPKEQIRLFYKYGYIAEANDAMAKMYGLNAGTDLVGARLPDLLVESDPQNTAFITAFVESGYHLSGVESHEKDHQGNDRFFRNSLVGVVKDGMILRAWGTQQDVTEQYAMTRQVQESRERLALALRASRTGMWEWDVISNTLIWSDELKLLYGMSPKDPVDYDAYLEKIHPDDRLSMRRIIRHSMKTGEEYKIEHRIIWRDGSEHWVLGMGRTILEEGKPVRMIGTSVSLDDTKRKDELEEVNRKLREQRTQLVELNQAKNEFIALASHQLRTPATAVKQYIGMLLGGYFGDLDDEQRQAAEIALASNERQLAIISDLLRVAQLDAGNIVLRKQRTDVAAMLQTIVREQSARFRDKEQTIVLECGRSKLWASIDPDRMHMVFENLIDNAHKYTPAGKHVVVTAHKVGRTITVTIADQGVGIRKADLPRLFQKFSRLDHGMTDEVDGSGLGLYWAHKIVELHDGTLTVTSAVRRGSVFTVSFSIG